MIDTSSKKVTQMLGRILGAELYKLISLPSIWLILICTLLVNIILVTAFASTGLQEATGTSRSILDIALTSMSFLQAGFIVLGISATCSEYNGGQIRTTLTTIPWRGLQLSMKHLALAILSIPMTFIIMGSGMLYASMMMGDAATPVESNSIINTLTGATGYLTLTTLLSAATGALLRRTTPALVMLLSYYFIVSPLLKEFIPSIAHVDIENYFPDTAGSYMYTFSSPDKANALTPIQGASILLLWTLVLISLAIVLYRKRDA